MSYSFDSYYTDRFGSEHKVRVDYSYSRAEYGFPATLELEAAWFEDEGCVLDQLTPGEYHGLKMRAWDDYNERGERRQAMLEDAAEARREDRLYELEQRRTHRSLVRDGEMKA